MTRETDEHPEEARGLKYYAETVRASSSESEINEALFKENSEGKLFPNATNILFWGFLIVYTFIIVFGELLILPRNEWDWCHAAQEGFPNLITNYPNPDTNNNPCYHERTIWLMGLSPFETDFSRRMITSVILGSIVGYERKEADRPAGVRTMALVSLGACFFTMCSQHAFTDSPQTFDAARTSAAIPSGVGFLGSALIWKQSTGTNDDQKHEVRGLTTAASVWLSAAIGIGAGGHLYVISVYAVILVVFVLRLGPSMYLAEDLSAFDSESEWDDTEDEDDDVVLTKEELRKLLKKESDEARSSGHQTPLTSPNRLSTPTGSRMSTPSRTLTSPNRQSTGMKRRSSKVSFHG